MIYLEMEKSSFDIVQYRLPDVCPNVRFSLIATDKNLHTLGFSSDELCIVAFDLDNEVFKDLCEFLNKVEK